MRVLVDTIFLSNTLFILLKAFSPESSASALCETLSNPVNNRDTLNKTKQLMCIFTEKDLH